jgi:hypothetical protein
VQTQEVQLKERLRAQRAAQAARAAGDHRQARTIALWAWLSRVRARFAR